MRYERREMQALNLEVRNLAVMLEALQRRIRGGVGG
jgi:hypothetical protein